MGLIQTASDLQTAIVEYLARDQDTVLIARVPTFIQLLEGKLNRSLLVRQMETRSQAVTDPTQINDPEYVALPPDFQMMRRLSVTAITNNATGSTFHRKHSLEYITPTQMDELKSKFEIEFDGGLARHVRKYTIFGNEIELYPTPFEAVTLEMIYRQNLPPLATNITNWLLTLFPDIYLYGSLMESAPYIKEDTRIPVWGSALQSAMGDLATLSNNLTYATGPLQVRVDHRSGGGNFRR
jgi:hypothetical protein